MKNLTAFCKNLWQRMNWRPNLLTWATLAVALITVPALLLPFNPQLFVENGWVENIQLVILVAAIVIACRAKNDRQLFIFAAFVVVFMILRETNMFRDIFCMKYLPQEETCRWSAFKYGYLVSAARWLFAAYVVYYVWRYRLWRTAWQYICKAPIYVWDLLLLGLAGCGATVAEFSCVDSETMEECCELVLYLALANCIWRYSKRNNA
ncbi:MAG: hypothetical protein IKR92_03840 [Alphaproteobacteria bacterium]|nr:hypothetical protein [Alphaproteobacteria bacterium]